MGELGDFLLFCDSKAGELYRELRDRTGRSFRDDFFDPELARMATEHARNMARIGAKCTPPLFFARLSPLFCAYAEEEVDFGEYSEALRCAIDRKFLPLAHSQIRHCIVFETGVGIRDYPEKNKSKVFAAVYGRF